MTSRATDVIVVGGGLVGLACAAAIADRGSSVLLLSERRPGEASPAAAGMLAPSVERATGAAHAFAVAARDRYPAYLAGLAEATGRRVPLLRNGILEVAVDARAADELRRAGGQGATWLDREELGALEPALARSAGALFHPDDGAVDNVTLLAALEQRVAAHPGVRVLHERAVEVTPGGRGGEGPRVRTASGAHHAADTLVLAAGAWVGTLAGLPRALPVVPVRGQMLSFAAAPVGHVAYGPRGYIVPRGGATVAGSTMELVGFEIGTTADGVTAIAAAAAELCPSLAGAPVRDRWSGLRPVTPDLLPIIGRDAEHPAVLYACGHSRNGVLQAPITGDCVAALVAGETPAYDLTPFRADRFARSDR